MALIARSSVVAAAISDCCGPGWRAAPAFTDFQLLWATLTGMETLNFLLDRPLALFLVLAIGAAIGIGVERIVERERAQTRKAYWQGRNAAKKSSNLKAVGRAGRTPKDELDFAALQLAIVSRNTFTSRSLLNKSEAKVFEALDKAVVARNPDWQVMAQVSLGEFLASPDKEAYLAVNSKRVDFALMDADCRVVHAIEYQGSGHHTGQSAAARDAVKKEALRKAGIGYHEVVAGHTTPGELRALVEKLVASAS
jgi:hypothetical protein